MVPATEVSTPYGHVVALDVPRALTREERDRDALGTIAALGGQAVLAHPFHPRRPFTGWGRGPWRGFEIVSNDTAWHRVLSDRAAGKIVRAAAALPWDGAGAVLALSDDPADELARFDAERGAARASGGPRVLLCSADAHGYPGYRAAFEAFSMRVPVERSGDADTDARAVTAALLDGSAACVFDGVAPAGRVRLLRPDDASIALSLGAPPDPRARSRSCATGARRVRSSRARTARRSAATAPVRQATTAWRRGSRGGRGSSRTPCASSKSAPREVPSLHLVYVIASYALFLVTLPVLLTHPKLRHGVAQRLGLYRRGLELGRGSPRIWLHGASAGDLLSLQPMMRELRRRLPGSCIIVTTITNSGLEMARKKLAEADVVLYAPYDLSGATRRAVAALRPDLLVLEYTEIWPNLIRAARKAGVRIALTNGRFNPAKLSRYRTLFRAIRNPLRRIDCFLMRSDEEAERALALGAAPDRVWVTGQHQVRRARARRRGGQGAGAGGRDGARHRRADASWPAPRTTARRSSCSACTQGAPRAQPAPPARHRAPLHRALREDHGARRGGGPRASACGAAAPRPATRRSRSSTPSASSPSPIGWRRSSSWAAASSRAAGRTCSSPRRRGSPCSSGPHMENFKDSVQVLQGRGGIQVASPEQLLKVAEELLSRPDQLEELGALARGSVTSIRGASARNVEHMLSVLPRSKAAAA